MKYHLKAANAEWTIEPWNQNSWVLKERTEADWRAVGTFSTPNEAAAIVGALKAKASDWRERHNARLGFVLSCWEMSEQN